MTIKNIYADYNATTPLADEVVAAISKSLVEDWGNPSSQHELGKKASSSVKHARSQIATLIDGNSDEIVFMSGGTEANNTVIFGVCFNAQNAGIKLPHVITTNVEHDSVALPLKHLKDSGKITLTEVEVSANGLLTDDVLAAITDNTVLITIMSANNETGVLMPITEIGKHLEEVNINRVQCGLPSIVFHSDGAQIIGKMGISVTKSHLDCFTIVGHKFHGPRIGALWTRVDIMPLLFGGGQESGHRPGTENVPMIVGLGVAAELVTNNLAVYESRMLQCKEKIISKLTDDHFVNKVLGRCHRLQAGVGAACHSSKSVSAILLKSGLNKELASSTIRLSVGRETTLEDAESIVEDLEQAVLILNSDIKT